MKFIFISAVAITFILIVALVYLEHRLDSYSPASAIPAEEKIPTVFKGPGASSSPAAANPKNFYPPTFIGPPAKPHIIGPKGPPPS